MHQAREDRILLVDDMPSIHEDFRRILTPARAPSSLEEAERALFGAPAHAAPASSFQLDCASGGEEGLAFLRAALVEGNPYALAFVDMRMPAGWGGVRTIEELWREDPHLQVVICTAYSDEPLEQALARLGAPDRLLVLKKPFDPIEVSQLARALVSKRRLALESAAHLANLDRVLRELRDAADELRRRNRELESIARGVSQNLRSPLMAISRFTRVLSRELDTSRDSTVAEYLDRLREGARCSEQLLDGVRSLTDLASCGVASEKLNLSEIARALVAERRMAQPARQISVSVQEGLHAWCDRKLVTIALDQLLDNAWKFTAHLDRAAVTVGAQPGCEGEWVYFVRDSGSGFDASRAVDLFRKFQKLHPASEYPGGGVGLVTVGRIVERHGGHVWAESSPGHGATVYFTLPHPSNTFTAASTMTR